MKIYVATSLWMNEQIGYLRRVMNTWAYSRHEIHFTIDTNIAHDWTPYLDWMEVEEFLNPREERRQFFQCWNHKPRMVAVQNDYDLFVYQENDMLILDRHIRYFLEYTKKLPEDQAVGFLRYEKQKSGRYLVEVINKGKRAIYNKDLVVNDEPFFQVDPAYWAFFIVTREQLKRCIEAGGFENKPRLIKYGLSESAAAEPYLIPSVFSRVLYPWNRLEDLLVHHQSNRFSKGSTSNKASVQDLVGASPVAVSHPE